MDTYQKDDTFTNLVVIVKIVDIYEERLDIIKDEAEFITTKELTQSTSVIVNEYKDRVKGFVDYYINDGGSEQEVLNALYENFYHISDVSVREAFLRACVNKGVDLDLIDECGETVLLKAVVNDETELVSALLKYGASPNLLIEGKHLFNVISNDSADLVKKRYEENLKIETSQKKTSGMKTKM